MSILDKFPIIRNIKHAVAQQAAKYFIQASLVEGILKGSDQPFRILFFGKRHFTKYLQKRMYQQQPNVLRTWRIPIKSIKQAVAQNPYTADLCVAILPKSQPILENIYSYKGTELVRQAINTSGDWEYIRKKFSSKKRRIANNFEKKFGLGFRISRDKHDLQTFHTHMFAPLIKKRFGDLAEIESVDEMQEFFQKGFLLFVTKDGTDLAGNLCHVEGDTLVLRRAGVLDGDDSHVEAGAQTALYYFGLKYANEQGLRTADAMMSDPFLNDGVYMTKREWGAVVSPSDDFDTWVYFINLGSKQALAHFYAKNPFIALTDTGLKGLIGIPEGQPTPELLETTLRPYRSEGLTGFIILTSSGTMEAE